jgi:3'(2'), 5'-bisphosphate nucleotidase
VNDLLQELCRISSRAAAVVREVYDTPFSVDYKGPRDPVTDADRRANVLICEELARSFPGVPVVAEESDPASFAGYRVADTVFFVDPLDGTREFIDRNGEFVVMIGLIEGARATAGLVHAPAQRRLWAGRIGHGAFHMEEGGQASPISVSRTSNLEQARVVASRSHRSEALERALGTINARELVAVGSAGLKGAEIATGRADIYVGPGHAGKRWDVCAVEAIVTAAGGRMTDAFGEAFDYRTASLTNDRGILATNGLMHDAVLERIAGVVGA